MTTVQGQDQVRVSVVLAVHDPGPEVRTTLESLGRTLGPSDELVVVDDGSTDGTPDRVRSWLEDHPDLHRRTRLIALPENRGVARARNAGLQAATGAWIWFVDWDDAWSVHILDLLHEAAVEADATVAMCGAEHVDEHGVPLRRLDHRALRPRTLRGPAIGLAVLEGRLEGYLWNKLFARPVLGPDPFPPERSQSDFVGVAELLARQPRIRVLPDVLYDHVRRPGSISNTVRTSTDPFLRSLEVAERVAERLLRTDPRPTRRRVDRGLRVFRYRRYHLAVAHTALRLSRDSTFRRTMLGEATRGMRWDEVVRLVPDAPLLAGRCAVLLATGRRYPAVYDRYVDARRRLLRRRRPRHRVEEGARSW